MNYQLDTKMQPFLHQDVWKPHKQRAGGVILGESGQQPTPRHGGVLESRLYRACASHSGDKVTLQATYIAYSVAATAKGLWRHRRVLALRPVNAFVGKRLKRTRVAREAHAREMVGKGQKKSARPVPILREVV